MQQHQTADRHSVITRHTRCSGHHCFFLKLELNSGKAETRFAKEQKHKIKGFQSAAGSVSAYTNLPCMAVVSYSRSMWSRTW